MTQHSRVCVCLGCTSRLFRATMCRRTHRNAHSRSSTRPVVVRWQTIATFLWAPAGERRWTSVTDQTAACSLTGFGPLAFSFIQCDSSITWPKDDRKEVDAGSKHCMLPTVLRLATDQATVNVNVLMLMDNSLKDVVRDSYVQIFWSSHLF